MGILVPAVLSTSREDLEQKIELFAKMPHVTRIQIDTVDGKFAAPASWPYTDVARFRQMAEAGEMLPRVERFEYEIDLMNLDAERAGELWLSVGASRLTFHAETTTDLPRLLERMHERTGGGPDFSSGLSAFGVAFNFSTELALIEPALSRADYIQFMGIRRIGVQGQPFDEHVYDRIRTFRNKYPHIPVQVDGGVKLEEARKLVGLGVTNVIVGSGLLRAADPVAEAEAFDELENSYGV